MAVNENDTLRTTATINKRIGAADDAQHEALRTRLKAERRPQPKGTRAVGFLQQLAPKRAWTLTAIIPDGTTTTDTFDQPEEARRFIAQHIGARRGVYYSVNPTKTRLQSKACKDDIARIEYLHVDADPVKNETPAAFKKRLRAQVAAFDHPPTFIVDSGNGLQLLWRLQQPVDITGPEAIADIEARNHALAEALGANPSTRNIDRILRLPGTTNFPNAAKAKLGRIECEAKLIEFNDRGYALNKFPPKAEPTTGANEQPDSSALNAGIPRNVQALLYLSGPKGEPIAGYDTRSGLLMGFLTGAVRASVPDAWILDALFDRRFTGNAIWEHVAESGGSKYAERQLIRAHAKVAEHHGDESIHNWKQPDPSLLDDRRGELPEFPLDALEPEWLRDWVRLAAHSTATTVDHVAVPLLGIASAVIGSARRVQATRGWTEPMTAWIAVVGLSGSGKTPGLDTSRKPLVELELNRKDDHDALKRAHAERTERAGAAYKQWKAAVAKAVKQNRATPARPDDAETPAPLVLPRLFTTDITIESMTVLLQARTQGMLLLTDELAALFLNMSRYSGGTDRQFYLMAWDGRPYSVDRKGQPPIQLPRLLIGLVGGLQPDKLAEIFKGAADGMSARFLYTWPSTPEYQPLTNAMAEVDHDMVDILDKLDKLEASAVDQRRLPLTKQARVAFEKVRKAVITKADRYDGSEREWWCKIPTQVLRLAGTLALLEWAVWCDKPIPKDVKARYVKAADRLARKYFWPHARAALRQIGLTEQHADKRRVLRWIKATSKTQIGREQVRVNALRRNRDANQTQAMLDALVQAGWLREQKVPSKGRPTVRWDVNPLLAEK